MRRNIQKIAIAGVFLAVAASLGLFSYGKVHAVAVAKINTLAYFVNTTGTTLNGSHAMSQTVSGNNIYFVKWDSDSYEHYTYDNNYIYLKEDHSAETSSYTFSDGRWMMRQMAVGQSINVNDNNLQNFNASTTSCTPTTAGLMPYVMTLTQHIPNYNVGGTVGTKDVIVLQYDYRAGLGTQYERNYYAKGLGLVKWELYNNSNQVIATSTFDTTTNTPPTPPSLTNACINTPVPTSDVPALPTTMTGFVSELYSCVLGVQNLPTSDSGFQFWLNQLNNGLLSVPGAYADFYSYQPDHLSNITNAQFADSLYRCILFRDVDPVTEAAIATDLDNGTYTKPQLVQSILSSNEFNKRILPLLP